MKKLKLNIEDDIEICIQTKLNEKTTYIVDGESVNKALENYFNEHLELISFTENKNKTIKT
jgi:hypothetical protein